MSSNQYILYCIFGMVILYFFIYQWNKKIKEGFTADILTLEKIRTHIVNTPSVEYSRVYLKYLLDNQISNKKYMEQQFYYGCIALKRLGILTSDNMLKLL